MRNRRDSDGIKLCSQIRTGLKREFAFAMKVQAEISGHVGRTRSGTPQNAGTTVEDYSYLQRKRTTRSCSKSINYDNLIDVTVIVSEEDYNNQQQDDEVDVVVEEVEYISEEEPKSDVVDLSSDDEDEINGYTAESSITEESRESELAASGQPGADSSSETEGKGHIVNYEGDDVLKNASPVLIFTENKKDFNTRRTNLENFLHHCNSENILTDDRNLNSSMNEKNSKYSNCLSSSKSEIKGMEVALTEKGIEDVNSSNDFLTRKSYGSEGAVDPLVIVKEKNIKPEIMKSRSFMKCPTKLRELLDTGILEGFSVQYVRGTRVRGPNETGLRGTISGSGILCSCETCKGKVVVTPNQFEIHAGSSNKRPPEYIYLENGITFRDVLNACKDSPLDDIERRILNLLDYSWTPRSRVCSNCREPISISVKGSTTLCDSCVRLKDSRIVATIKSDVIDRSPKPDLHSKPPDFRPKNNSMRNKGPGRLTRKDLRLHKRVFEEDVLPDGTELAYYARGQKLLVGYKKGFGIFCTCCNSEVSPSQFEAHAGWATRRKPYLHIYTSNGVSLHELSISLSRGRKCSIGDNDDLCTICADGGDLLCCDGCPRSFHKDCISLSSLPGENWYCKYCETMFRKEKIIKWDAEAMAAGKLAGVDLVDLITKSCIRIVNAPESEYGGCVLCRGHGFTKDGFGSGTVILCDQCEKEYHIGCLKKYKVADLTELPEGQWFCCGDCERIHSLLEALVSGDAESVCGSVFDVIKRKHELKNPSSSSPILDVKWRLLKGRTTTDQTRLLSKAVSIFHERFDPILEVGTNRDFIPHMVYGRNMRDQEFGNMLCALLLVNSVVVSAGIFRIFGEEVAEVPLVATATEYEGMGYFQCLFSRIESLLRSLKVKNMVLPAAEEAESIWINKFGFLKLTSEEFLTYRQNHAMMMTFQGTSMLHKPVPGSP